MRVVVRLIIARAVYLCAREPSNVLSMLRLELSATTRARDVGLHELPLPREQAEATLRACCGVIDAADESADIRHKAREERMLKDLIRRGARLLGYEVRRPPVGEDAFALQRTLTEDASPVIFDVGAHEGKTVKKYLDLLPGAQLHAFEPSPHALGLLRARFGADPRVTIHPVALSDQDGTALINSNKFVDTNSMLASDPRADNYWASGLLDTTERIEVRTSTLDAIAAQAGAKRIHLLKLDVQGYELTVLAGAEKLLREHTIDVVLCEIILAPTYQEQKPLFEYLRFFHERGYVLFSVHDLQRRDGQLLQMDALFVTPAVEQRARSRRS